MATFKDPIDTLIFELPAGWAYDQLYSTLTDFSFVRWDNPQEVLAIHLRRAAVKADSPDEEWIAKIREEVGEQRELIDMDSPNGRAVAVDFVSAQEMTQRVAFIRGEYVDVAIEQRNADRNVPEPWSALTGVVKTAASSANMPQEGPFGPVEFNKTVEAANTAFEKKDYEAVSQSLHDAIRIGTAAWLSSLTSSSGAPEVNAAVRVAQAMVHLGRFTGNPFLSRDAASILHRALCSLEAAGKDVAEQAKSLIDELKEILEDIESEFLEKKDSEESRDSAPVIAIRERGLRLAQAGAMAFDAADFESAAVYARASVDDLLFLLAYFRRGRAQQIPDEILKHLVDQGISDHEEQRDAIQKTREGVLFPALNLSLQINYCCALENKDALTAREAAQLYLPLARQIAESSPGDTSIKLNVVLALLDSVGAIAATQDTGRLQAARTCLEEAAQILDDIGDTQCRDDGWVRNYKQQAEKSLQILVKWPESDTSEKNSDLKSLYSKFEGIAERLRGKISKTDSAG